MAIDFQLKHRKEKPMEDGSISPKDMSEASLESNTMSTPVSNEDSSKWNDQRVTDELNRLVGLEKGVYDLTMLLVFVGLSTET